MIFFIKFDMLSFLDKSIMVYSPLFFLTNKFN